MEDNQKKYTELANRIYDLDGAVYECVGSSLGRTFTEGSRRSEEETILPGARSRRLQFFLSVSLLLCSRL